jgi:hypothetical protein
MLTATTITRWIVGLTGATQVVLGILFWTGHALTLVPVHMVNGLAFVLAIWVLAAFAARLRVRRSLAIATALWGALVIALGIGQGRLLPGSAHWVVQALHLAVGLAAMSLAVRLTAAIRKSLNAREAALVPVGPSARPSLADAQKV